MASDDIELSSDITDSDWSPYMPHTHHWHSSVAIAFQGQTERSHKRNTSTTSTLQYLNNSACEKSNSSVHPSNKWHHCRNNRPLHRSRVNRHDHYPHSARGRIRDVIRLSRFLPQGHCKGEISRCGNKTTEARKATIAAYNHGNI